VEEKAITGIYVEVLGGAKAIPGEMLKAIVDRRDKFPRAGTQQA
jgi:hypothetical protein